MRQLFNAIDKASAIKDRLTEHIPKIQNVLQKQYPTNKVSYDELF